MVRRGTVKNGVIVPHGPPLPEGTQVLIETCDGLFTDETYEEYIESLKQSIAETEAGIPGIPLEEAMEQLREELRQYAAASRR